MAADATNEEQTKLTILFANIFAPTIDYFVVRANVSKDPGLLDQSRGEILEEIVAAKRVYFLCRGHQRHMVEVPQVGGQVSRRPLLACDGPRLSVAGVSCRGRLGFC